MAPRLMRGADVAVGAGIVLLPFALLHARALADLIVSATGALFLLRSALLGTWDWMRRPWVRVAALLWLWLLLATAIEGPAHAVVQAAVVLRLLLFVVACEAWALRDARTRRWLGLATAAAAVWVAVECWQQLLTGANLFGAVRWGDGALTGPFVKPHAGSSYLAVLFPAVLPPALRLIRRGDLRGWLGALLLLAAAAATMVLIGQRMPTLLMALGLVFAALLVPALRLPALAALALGALVIALTPIVSPPTYQKLVLHFLDQMQHFWDSNYGQIYLRALAMVQASPLFGVGVDGFRDDCLNPAFVHGNALLGVSDAQVNLAIGCNIHPHNYWLQMATSGGLPALLAFGVLVALWLGRILRGLDPAVAPMRAALLVMLATLLWPIASSSSLFVIDAGGWVFLAAGWGLAEAAAAAASDRQADAGA